MPWRRRRRAKVPLSPRTEASKQMRLGARCPACFILVGGSSTPSWRCLRRTPNARWWPWKMCRRVNGSSRSQGLGFHLISFHFISFHFISFHFISFHFISFHFMSDCVARSLWLTAAGLTCYEAPEKLRALNQQVGRAALKWARTRVWPSDCHRVILFTCSFQGR